ncbi:zinc finger protein 700-like [Sitodiplosis mosellana]|uniref:zinc finger protein 700-like n=1 Tax=Sitodiplosis mosellana TaxID=263140 RepID=UPI002443F972|nr:zinc finger protein 700-like [Sitodiplosis mosellana]
MRKRYCGVNSCPNFTGTADENVPFFRLPIYEPELLAKWKQAVNRETTGTFKLCGSHFRQEDLIKSRRNIRLKPGAIPMPVPKTVKTEISYETIIEEPPTVDSTLDELPTEEPHTEHVEIMDIEANESASDEQELCQSCINYEVQLQAAHAEITALKKKLSELTVENNMMKTQIRSISTKYSTCHRISTIQEPGSVTLTIEPDQPISIDEKTLNDCSMLSASFLSEEMDESSSDESPTASMSGPSKEIEQYKESIRTVDIADVSLEPRQSTLKLFQCGRCDMAFELAIELSRHITEYHSIKTVTVPRLPKEKTRAARKKKEGKSYQCYLCRMSFNTFFNGVHVHMKRHERDQKCEICKTELTLNELNSHLCGDEKSIRCDYCADEFTATSKLVEHLDKSHEKGKLLYRCEKCSKYFSMFALKELHMKVHDRAPKQFVCKVCHKNFASKLLRKVHVKRHNETNSHLCEECGKSFGSARSLQLHKRAYIHNKELIFHCPHCSRKFFNRQTFSRHRDKHREFKYVCEICQTEHPSKQSFEAHMKRHHRRTEADRKYACKLCPLKFFSSQILKSHQKVHTSVRLFNCQFCNQSYKYKGDLNKHLKTHIGNKIHKCKKCFELFEYKDLLKHEDGHYLKEKEANETNE